MYQTTPKVDVNKIKKGKELGKGGFSTVYLCNYEDKVAALKIFRSSTDDKVDREVEMLFSLRHPHIIGLYGYFRIPGVDGGLTQAGVLLEFAGGGDLSNLYTTGTFTFLQGLKVITGASKGIAYMRGF